MQRFLFLFLCCCLCSQYVLSQHCHWHIEGFVYDEKTQEPLQNAHIINNKNQEIAFTDSVGKFILHNMCDGENHISISHIGCTPQRFYIHLHHDSTISFYLNHAETTLNEVQITDNASNKNKSFAKGINDKVIIDNANKNLSQMMENIAGVQSMKNGNAIAKPVVQGLYGVRLPIINHGLTLAGQQWGNDHSPEIDPLSANKIRVVKGVQSLEYLASSVGSIVLIESKRIDEDPHLHGNATYVFETNGLGNHANVQFEQSNRWFSWRTIATYKISGDKRTPNYYLRNTGNRETNIAFQLEKKIGDKWMNEIYISSFNTIIGVLRGAHISNLTQLQQAFEQEKPFYTEDKFYYKIDAPYQKVRHHTAKWNGKYILSKRNTLQWNIAEQWNQRSEYDVRRLGRSNIPALSLSQFTSFAEAKLTTQYKNEFLLKKGVQANYTYNINNVETGILPLIPDYDMIETGAFVTAQKKWGKIAWEAGLRADYKQQNAVVFERDSSSWVRRNYNQKFPLYNASSSVFYTFNNTVHLGYNVLYAMRNPAVNELFSNGLHQGVSGIEVGNKQLRNERVLNNSLILQTSFFNKLYIDVSAYHQHFFNYIFLQPTDEIRLTIRGAFPVFAYNQAVATISGTDFTVLYQHNSSLSAKMGYSYLYGQDKSNDAPLVYMPGNRLNASIKYEWAKWKHLENIEIEMQHKYVFKQSHLLPSQDFVTAPESYYVVGLQVASNIQLHRYVGRVFIKVENALNNRYRDYMNRLRYFSDETGINVSIGLNLKF